MQLWAFPVRVLSSVSVAIPCTPLYDWIWAAGAPRCHGVLVLETPGDLQCQAARLSRPLLVEGRPVLGFTIKLGRAVSMGKSVCWHWCIFGCAFGNHVGIDELNKLLVEYARDLYVVGQLYNFYAEMIGFLATKKLTVGRQMMEAWNHAFVWVCVRSSVHHLAMPWQFSLAAITVGFFIGLPGAGWNVFAYVGSFAKSWQLSAN